MGAPLDSSADELTRLRTCLDDLLSIMALPALRTGGEPPRIVRTLLDTVAQKLRLAFALVCLNDPEGNPSIEMARVAKPLESSTSARHIAEALEKSLGDSPLKWPPSARVSIRDVECSVAVTRLGLQGELGVVIAGSQKIGFPELTEQLLLNVAVNQAALALQPAYLLSGEKRISKEFNKRGRATAKDELGRTERESWRVIDSIPGPIVTLTKTGDVDMVNRHLLEYFGTTIDEIRQWATNDLVHPEDLPQLIELTTRSIESGASYENDQRLRRFDGVYCWFQARAFPLPDANGQIVQWCVLLTDIDERKRAEAELRRAYDSFADAQRLSRTGNFTADIVADDHIWSPELYRIFEIDPATRIKLQLVHDIIHPEDVPSFDAAFARSLGGADFDQVFRIVPPSGNVKHVHAIGRVTERVAGRPLFIGAIQDVTESKAAEDALNRARSELAHVTRISTLSALTASIAHEVNQPLAAAVVSSDSCTAWLASVPPNVVKARAAADRVAQAVTQASAVVQRIRTMFKKAPVVKTPLQINQVIEETLSLLQHEIASRRILLRTDLAEGIPLVWGDRVQITQVILNLAKNAIEAMAEIDEKLRRVTIRSLRFEETDVHVSVADSGPGVDPNVLDRLFNPFFTTKADGTGMGLSISRSIIEAHGGRLWAAANEPSGAVFHFALPTTANE